MGPYYNVMLHSFYREQSTKEFIEHDKGETDIMKQEKTDTYQGPSPLQKTLSSLYQ